MSQFASQFASQLASELTVECTTSFEEKLHRLLMAVGAASDSALARELGIKPQSVVAARRRKQIPTGWVEHVAEKFGVSSDWLFFGEGPMKRGEVTPASNGAYRQAAGEDFGLVLVPKVKARLSAGTGSLETDGAIKGLYSFREDWIASKGNPERMVLMEVAGDSMFPDIWSKDTVLIDESRKDIIAGGVYAVGIDDEVVVKYVEKLPGKLILRSKNHEEFPPIEVDMREHLAESVRIIGRVIWTCRELS